MLFVAATAAVVALTGASAIGARAAWAAAPSAPTSVSVWPLPATSTFGPLRVQFVPAVANGSPVASYHVVCTSGTGVPGGALGTNTPISVPHLTTGARYSCTVTAKAADGSVGPASSPGSGFVGAPEPPIILRTVRLGATSLILPLQPLSDNGSPIIDYRTHCTSTNGGIAQSPLQIASPVVVQYLTTGATYVCRVNAENLRGSSPPSWITPVVVGAPLPVPFATCTATSGTLTASPGYVIATAATQALSLAVPSGSCTGPLVSAGRMSFAMRSAAAVSCGSALSVANPGYGTFRWSAPGGMGKSDSGFKIVFASTTGHISTAKIFGTVTSKNNVFSGRVLSGTLTIDRGFAPAASGGDCTQTPLTSFHVTSISVTLT